MATGARHSGHTVLGDVHPDGRHVEEPADHRGAQRLGRRVEVPMTVGAFGGTAGDDRIGIADPDEVGTMVALLAALCPSGFLAQAIRRCTRACLLML